MKELVKPIKLEKQQENIQMYGECSEINVCGVYNGKETCGTNICSGWNDEDKTEDDIIF